jgi:hypothetical protein
MFSEKGVVISVQVVSQDLTSMLRLRNMQEREGQWVETAFL